MFVKGKEEQTLAKNFLEAIKVEKDLVEISSHQGNEESKAYSSNKNIKKSKGISKKNSNEKDKDLMNMESMHRIINQLTNEIIDLKKNKGEENKPFKPFLKKKTNTYSTPQIPPTSSINLEYYAMENYCCKNHANHSEKNMP